MPGRHAPESTSGPSACLHGPLSLGVAELLREDTLHSWTDPALQRGRIPKARLAAANFPADDCGAGSSLTKELQLLDHDQPAPSGQVRVDVVLRPNQALRLLLNR